MFRTTVCALAIMATATLSTSAAPVITIGNHNLQPNTPGQVISIMASGELPNDGLLGIDLFLVAGGGTEGPLITGIDLIGAGTIFNGNNNGQQSFGPPFDPPSREIVGLVSTASGSVDPNGVLAYLTVDTTGLFSGDFTLSLTNELIGPSALYTQGGASTVLVDGTLSVVPEPSSVVLGLLAATALLGLNRRRRFR